MDAFYVEPSTAAIHPYRHIADVPIRPRLTRMEYGPGPLPDADDDALARDIYASLRRDYADPSLVMYGVADWVGAVSLAGAESTMTDGTCYRLDHADQERLPDADEPRVQVSIATGKPADLQWTLALRGIDRRPEDPGFDPRLPVPEATEATVEIDVDGVPVAFDVLEALGGFAAAAAVDGVPVEMAGRGIDVREIGLIRVRDLTPYIEGTERWWQLLRPDLF